MEWLHDGTSAPGAAEPHGFTLEDDHDWERSQQHPGGMVPQPLGALPPVGAAPPGKPVLMLPDTEATESEGDRGPLAGWEHASAATAASQPSPTPSVSLAHPAVFAPAAAAPAPAAARKGGSKGGSKGARRPGGKSAISLAVLIEEGVLQPGHNVLSVDYKGTTQLASLMPDGRISSQIGGQQQVFESPSAFSIYLKRLLNPTRKADDGWKTVRYNGRVLEQFKADLVQRRLAEGGGGGSASAATASDQRQQAQPASKRARVGSSSDLTSAVTATLKDGDRAVLKLKFQRPGGGYASGPYPAAEQGDHQRARPRRQVQAPVRYAALGLDDEHALQPLEAYAPGPPGTAGAQPFTVLVSPAAEVLMDAHAHLCMSEVIGVLAGEYDAASRTITVLRAHPVLELATENGSVSVEMNPEDEWRVRQIIEEDCMRTVGWYHSHPEFPTNPSTIDIYNQCIQQHFNRDEQTGDEPYIAAIVGPYDQRLGSLQSSLTWFYVEHAPGQLPAEGQPPSSVGCVAKAIHTQQLVEDGGRSVAEIAAMPACTLPQLARRYGGRPAAADLSGVWRDGCTHLHKLVASLQSRLPAAHWGPEQLQDLGARLRDVITAAFRSAPKPVSRAMGPDSDDEAISSDDGL